MVAIEGIGRPTASRVAARGAVADAPVFALPEEAAATGGASAAATASPASLASMLTLQELGGEPEEDREARRHGQNLLTALAELQRALLAGGDESVALQRLAELAAAVPCAADRRLAAMVSAIVVRVRVELARRHL
jgi:hypothetical protein